jgi:FO synthase subunit 1
VFVEQVTKSVEDDIQLSLEDAPDALTYSLALPMSLSRLCRNNCPYCGFRKRDSLMVPYSTIKLCKQARAEGAREVLYISGERPDKFPHVRALLDLWGFESYVDYVYTISELGFLEGFIPVVELGFLSPVELKRLYEVAAVCRIMLDSVDEAHVAKIYPESPGKRLELRLKVVEWAGKLGFPINTGIMVGIGESASHRRDVMKEIASLHKQYGHIHEFTLQNFSPEPGTKFEGHSPTSKKDMLAALEVAKNLLPSDIAVTVPLELNPDIEPFIQAGVRDLGRIYVGRNPSYGRNQALSMSQLTEIAERNGLRLHQRLPIKKSFIKQGRYSKKLGQLLDGYRYKIKKELQEKPKAAA